MKAAVFALLATAVAAVAAQVTYTPAQLRKMIAEGRPPEQGAVRTTTEAMAFNDCVRTVRGTVNSIARGYPATTVVDTSQMLLVKLWTNDGALTMSCSSLDKKLVITRAPYR